MKCDDVMLVLDDLLDRSLDEADQAEVRAHLEECAACAEAHGSLVDVRDWVADLPRSIAPPRDLWPEIEARIAAKKVARGAFGRRALMAAAAALVLVSSVVTAYFVGRQQATSTVVVAPVQREATSEVLAASFAEIGVHDYEATRNQLLDVLDGRRNELSPATMEVVSANLRLIDEAMSEIADALGKDPGNELLMRRLVATYRQQVNLLERAAVLPREI
jgi:anti-sigma factor RsiW